MTQTTQVFVVDPREAAELEQRLRDGLPPDAEWRPVPHARFSVKALGVVLTCYRSGKVVLQGSRLEAFVDRFLPRAQAAAKGKAQVDDELLLDAATIGSDEAGKGDYFGPLVVAACFATPAEAARLAELGVTDSKTLDDRRARRLAGILEGELDHELIVVDPAEYNSRWGESRNLNTLLAELHAEAIGALYERHPDVEVVVVDRFAADRVLGAALQARGGPPGRLVHVPRAERHAVVAAASILARAAFLDGLDRCSDACGTDLHKGAGPPVDRVARRVVEIGGRDLLGTVAKLHFKNTGKIGVDR